MLVSNEVKIKHKELIRSIMSRNPRATLLDIQEKLHVYNETDLNIHYIQRLREKIKTERVVRYDLAKVNARVAEMQDKIEQVQKHLWKIILDDSIYSTGSDAGYPRVSVSAKIKAALAIIKSEKDLLDAQMDAGVFERKLGTLEANLNMKLETGQRKKIIDALKNYGVLKVECQDAEIITPQQITDGNNK